MVVVSIISMLAFIINVGTYVNAKINLQNAVDAAAYAGAAVQARQLTNMAYLNWELRNTYKEWMFKYYVLGMLSVTHVQPDNKPNMLGDGAMNFRLRKLKATSVSEAKNFDMYNVPSICIHFGSSNNICEIAGVPGIPRFESSGILGVSKLQEDFLDVLVSEKSKNCSDRSSLNFAVAMLWTYGTGGSPVFQGVPDIALDRQGAWVQAIELGIRMRNLEAIANRPPIEQGICLGGDGGCVDAATLGTEYQDVPLNERPLKAFYSAYRNLGHGSESGDELKSNFKLYELSPKPLNVDLESLSGLLYPDANGEYKGGGKFLDKHYVDLKAVMINYAILYTAFVAENGVAVGVVAQGKCSPSKTAIPVPGYLMGFVKNPDVVTYYAVKGESKFIGLFNPFKNPQITIRAYAAAKPFGGKIGPILFDVNSKTTITSRSSDKANTLTNAIGFDPEGIKGAFKPGAPIPTSTTFWAVSESEIIGGVPTSGSASNARFVIPNLLYDIIEPDELDNHFSGTKMNVLKTLKIIDPNSQQEYPTPEPLEKYGLYSKNQYVNFHQLLNVDGLTVDGKAIHMALNHVRAPTRYDALNYMIPPVEFPALNTESYGIIPLGGDSNDPQSVSYLLYAPLLNGDGGLPYKQISDIQNGIASYIHNAFKDPIENYNKGLMAVANSIADTFKDMANATDIAKAGESIYNPNDLVDPTGCATAAISQKFKTLLGDGGTPKCGIDPLNVAVPKYFEKMASTNPNFNNFYQSVFSPPTVPKTHVQESLLKYLTAYYPGENQGTIGGAEPVNEHPFGFKTDSDTPTAPSAKRSFYSVKFFNITKAITTEEAQSLHDRVFWEHGSSTGNMSDYQVISTFKNNLDPGQLSGFNDTSLGNEFFF